MNERIRELAGQALDKVVPYTWTTLDYDEIQKLQGYFAELIVRECAEICHSRKLTPSTFTGDELLEHFGVD